MGRKKPKFEHDFQRNSLLGFEPEGAYGYIRCLEHGVPNALIRWHHHEEYELHLIVNTSGKVFIGNYIGSFKPGNLVLIGPNLPHNWVSTDAPDKGVTRRDLVLQFLDEPFRKSCEYLPELQQALPLLDRAKNGIEFFGISSFAEKQLTLIKESQGIRRLNEFLTLILALSEHSNYKLLSETEGLVDSGGGSMKRISDVADYIMENYSTELSMANMAKKIGMDSSQFSRCFKQASGTTFTEFVNKVRINKACQLLIETDLYINTIGYEVGYNNIANFNRRFIEFKKMTPSAFRTQSKLMWLNK